MDYRIHYSRLIERAKARTLDVYSEKHHIIPKCVGGSNDKDNLVDLTPEEHYVAHQLLVKIHPDNKRLLHAAMMMVASNSKQQRNNKVYGWLKRRYICECRKRIGKDNPSYGKSWYYNPNTLKNGKFLKDDVPIGWCSGRKPKFASACYCQICGNQITNKKNATFCQTHRPPPGNIKYAEARFNERKDKFVSLIKEGYSFDISLKIVGYKNYNMKNGVGKHAQQLLDDLSIQRPLSPKCPPKTSA